MPRPWGRLTAVRYRERRGWRAGPPGADAPATPAARGARDPRQGCGRPHYRGGTLSAPAVQALAVAGAAPRVEARSWASALPSTNAPAPPAGCGWPAAPR